MERSSYWHLTQRPVEYPHLEKDTETDVLIVGGGISGFTAAYCLTQRGIQPVLIEAQTLCSGTTGNTTGKMTVQHGIIYSNLMEKFGIDVAKEFASSQAEALKFAAETVVKRNIQCQMADSTAYMFAMTPEEKDMLLSEYEAAKRMDILAEWATKPTFPPKCKALLGYTGQAILHPVRYVQGLARAAQDGGAKIYTHTKAARVEEGDRIIVTLDNGARVRCRHLIQATQYPIFDGPNVFYTRLYAKRDHAIAVETKGDWPEGSFINIGEPVRSIRTHIEKGKKIMILVGESHATGRQEETEGLPHDRLIAYASQLVGVERVLARWSAQDYQTPDQIPYIGRISDSSNIYVATGYRKWGLSSGTLAGMMLAEMIDEGHCKYEALYSRSRPDISSSLGKAASEVLASVGELIKSKFERTHDTDDLKKGEGRSIRFRGQRAGVYRDEYDHVTVVDITCTHMGTELNFNAAEKTWDCPAHGGRFKADGRLIEGPPKDNLKVLFQGDFEAFLNALEGVEEQSSEDTAPSDGNARPTELDREAAFNDLTPGPGYFRYPVPPGWESEQKHPS